MKGIALLVVLSILLTWAQVQAQEQQLCLPADEVERLATERRGDTWRHTDVVALTLTDVCVVRMSNVRLRINNKEYRWVGMKETGHWYRITSIKEERGRVWKDYTTEPREPTWIRVVVSAGPAGFEDSISVIQYTKPIRIVGLPDFSPSWVLAEVRKKTFLYAIEGLGVVGFHEACALEVPRPKDCTGFASSAGMMSLMIRYVRLERDFLHDRVFWKEAASLAAR